MEASLLVSLLIFLFTYAAIVSGRVERSIATMVGAVLMVIAGLYFGFYTEAEVIHEAIDWNTIGLLLGMMLIVGVLEDTGMFEALAVWVAKISRGRYFYMMILFGFSTAFASTTIDNVTTILLVVPISLSICASLGIDPRPIIITEAIFSNIGGVATLVGDPPNIMISSAADLSYSDFVTNLAPTVIICLLVSAFVLKILFSDKIEEESKKIKDKSMENLLDREPGDEIKDWVLFKKSIMVLIFVIILFVFHHEVSLEPATMALIGAAFILLLTRPDLDKVVSRVKWSTLLFFAGLFVIIHGIVKTGVLISIASGVIDLTAGNFLISTLVILFIAALGSAFVDNIPFTALMIPIVNEVSTHLVMSSNILWWALAFGAGFGGNFTYIGSSANVVSVKISEDHMYSMSFGYWMKYGATVGIITVGVSALALTIQIITSFHVPLLPG